MSNGFERDDEAGRFGGTIGDDGWTPCCGCARDAYLRGVQDGKSCRDAEVAILRMQLDTRRREAEADKYYKEAHDRVCRGEWGPGQ